MKTSVKTSVPKQNQVCVYIEMMMMMIVEEWREMGGHVFRD